MMTTTSTAPDVLTEWEKVTCSRCGGSGKHSYCQMYGTTCFKCAGAGRVLTARGVAAMAELKARRQTSVNDLRIGMRVRVDGYKKPLTIRDIKTSGSYMQTADGPKHYIDVAFDSLTCGYFPESTVEVVPETEEARVAQVKAAIAYQNTLTKAGKPRKTRRSGA